MKSKFSLRPLLLCLLVLTVRSDASAQFENIWIFGKNAGLNFNGGSPVPIMSSINTDEGAAVTCDDNGQLLFYTDGTTVWDRNNNVMPNGTGLQPVLNGTFSTSQGAQIIPVPDSAGKYYVFSLTSNSSQVLSIGKFYYSVVDMNLNGGLGDVVPGRKTIHISDGLNEQMYAVAGDNCNIWLLVTTRTDSLRAYEINRSGINLTPVKSPIQAGVSGYYNGIIGNIEVSPDRRKLVIARGPLMIYDFDINTGLISNPVRYAPPASPLMTFYCGVFSSDNTKLYATQGGTGFGTGVHQFDLSAGGAHTQLSAASIYGIRRAHNGKIYVLPFNGTTVHVIQNPNLAGLACQLDLSVITLLPGSSGVSKFSNPVPQIRLPDTIINVRNIVPPCGDTAYGFLSALDSSGLYYKWNDGMKDKIRPVSSGGTYWVQYEMGCEYHTDTFHVADLFNVPFSLGDDTLICADKFLLDAGATHAAGYSWNTGDTGPRLSISRSGTYWVQLSGFRCPVGDTIHVTLVSPPPVDIGADTIICEKKPLRIGAEVPGGAYEWNTGANTPFINVNASGVYILQVRIDGCVSTDTIQIAAMPDPEPDLGADGYLCAGQHRILSALGEPGSRYLWSNGDTNSAIRLTTASTCFVRVTSPYGCVGSDTVVFTFLPDPVVHLPKDTVVCEEIPLSLVPHSLNTDSLIWSDGTVGPSLSVRYGGEYIVTGANHCGQVSDTIRVRQIFCDIWLPNAFTPNGDGRNDVFRVLGNIARMEGFSIRIYNRWGEQMYYTTDKMEGWNGIYKGNPALMGTYVYLMEYNIDGKPYRQQGNFHLIR